MGQSRAEQETVFRWDEDEKVVHVWTASPLTWRKLARLGVQPTRQTTREGETTGRFYVIPLQQFRWGLKSARLGNPDAFRKGAPAPGEPGRTPPAAPPHAEPSPDSPPPA